MTDWKQVIEDLKDDNISIRRHRECNELITKRVGEIWLYICEKTNANLKWYCFSNDINAFENTDYSDGGFFDPVEYCDFINLVGEWNDKNMFCYKDGFPTSLIYEKDYKKVVNKTLLEEKRKFEAKKTNAKLKKEQREKLYKEKDKLLKKIQKLPNDKLKEIVDIYGK